MIETIFYFVPLLNLQVEENCKRLQSHALTCSGSLSDSSVRNSSLNIVDAIRLSNNHIMSFATAGRKNATMDDQLEMGVECMQIVFN